MSHLRNVFLGFTLAFLYQSTGWGVNSVPPLTWKPSAIGFLLGSEYLMSNGVYEDTRGNFHRLNNGSNLTSFENSFRVMYGMSGTWYAYAGMGLGITRVLENSVEKSNTNVSDLHAGSYFLLWQKYLRIIGEFTAGYSPEKISPTQTVPLLSDGATYFTARAHFFKPMWKINWLGQLGIHFPMEGLAKRLIYDVSLEKPFATNFSGAAGLGGYETLMNDDQSYAQRTQVHTTAMAGANRFQSYNPALLEGRIWFGFSPERTYRIRIGYAKSLNGIRSPESQSVFVQMNFNLSSGVNETDMNRYPIEERADEIERAAEMDLRYEERLKKNPKSTDPDELQRRPQMPPPPPVVRPKGPDALDATEKLMNDVVPREKE